MNNARLGLCVLLLCGLTACNNKLVKPEPNIVADKSNTGSGYVNAQRVIETDSEPENWLAHGRDYGEQRFSPLEHISQSNIDRLGLAWETPAHSMRGLEATPIVVDGVMYTTSTWSRVMALNAKTGAVLWQYDPKVERAWAKKLCCDVVNRGVAVWQGKVYVGTLDGYLIALDAQAGEVLWRVDTLIDRQQAYSITGAPRVIKGKVIIGNGGAEYAVRGYINAYDANSGDLAWRFYTVPGSAKGPFEHPELAIAAKTWDINSTFPGLGGTAWDSIAYDPALDLLYVGTGNGGPWAQHQRSPSGGDNLYLASILALRPDTGELVWHYQTTPGDSWDYTATQHMILADLKIAGYVRQVLMQAPKNGFFYVLDRKTGELISAEKYVFANWAESVDKKSGRPVMTEFADYRDQEKYVFPSAAGGHNWHPMSYSKNTGLVYVPAREAGWVHNNAGDRWFEWGTDDIESLIGNQVIPKTAGYLKAWDPVEQKLAWQMELPNMWNSGVLSTAGGLVIHGSALGNLYALNDRTGEVLLDIFVGTGMIAPPITYAIDGEQFIAIMAGWGGPAFNTLKGNEALLSYTNAGRIMSFKLDGQKVSLPTRVAARGAFPKPPVTQASAKMIEQGRKDYVMQCGSCHGMYGSLPMLPDLRRLSHEKHTIFKDIVIDGILEENGMPNFSNDLSISQVEGIQAYILTLSQQAFLDQL
ncbi:MAG: PQQ-dependent dehydrogenase, methanol/ethanol family [Porticoccaceae bacterium]|nr:PQQ-dependent dehydrogenase, methanol/ethanol family [Porticoccaceae bacterium]